MTMRGGGELLLEVERRRGAVVRSLQASLRGAIRDGRLRPGEALPATRQLATELGISRASVVEAYGRLAAEGFVTSQPGSATRVASDAGAPTQAQTAAVNEATFDLRPGGPDVSLFPWDAWARAAARVARTAPLGVLRYGDPSGQPILRAALIAYLARTRAVAARPDDLVVTAGVTQSLALICRALQRRGETVLAVEDPGPNTSERVLIRRTGLEPLPIPVDDEGIDVRALEASGAAAVLVTPAHQYPTGTVLSARRRRALVGWARAVGRGEAARLIIEDDYDAEFRYDRQAVASLQGLAPDRVAYLGSASKLLAPGLRLGWAAPPTWLAREVALEKAYDDFGSPTIDQLIFAELIEDGTLARHVRRARIAYRRRRDATLAAIATHLPSWRVRGVAAGLQVYLEPPRPIRERQIVRRAWRHGLWLAGIGGFHDREAPIPAGRPTGLVIGFAMVPESAIEESIATLAAIIAGEHPPSAMVRGLGHRRAARP